jgi:hypothetical protein
MPNPAITPETIIDARVLNIYDAIAGSTLAADATAGDSQVVLDDLFDFDETGGTVQISDGTNTESIGYTAVDDDTGTLTLGGTLVHGYAVEDGTFATPDPDGLEKHAQIIRDDVDDEVIEARVQHRWYDVLPEGIRDPDSGEAVTAAFDGADWVITDILGQTPLIDGSLIDDTTLPPPATSDGDPPSGSPTANVQGGIGTLFVSWIPVTNHDPVTYEVHISTTSGFTPDSTTLSQQVEASQAVIRTLPDGTPLDYSTVYYIQIIAKDTDGAAAAGTEASGSPAQITGPDIAAQAVTADNILANTLTADQIATVLEIAGTLETAAEGQRVVIDPDGAHLFGPDGSTIVDLPTDPAKDASFAGELDALALAVRGQAQFAGEAQVLPNGALHLVGGQPNPSLSPSLSASYPTAFGFSFGVDGNAISGSRITHYSATGGAGGTTPCYYGTLDTRAVGGTIRTYAVEWLASNGHINRSLKLDQGAPTTTGITPVGFGACLVGSTVIAAHISSGTGILVLENIDRATFTLTATVSSVQPGSTNLDPASQHVIGFGCDGTNPYFFSYNSTTKLPTKIKLTMSGGLTTGGFTASSFSSSAVKLFSPGDANNLGDSGGPTNVLGAAWDGTNWFVNFSWSDSGGTLVGRMLQMYNGSTSAIVAKQEIFLPFSVGAFGGGITYDGTDYYCVAGNAVSSNRRIKGTSALAWDYTLGHVLYAGYTWSDGTHHTGISPVGQISMDSGIAQAPLQRQTVIVTMPAIPPLASANPLYALFASSTPAGSSLKLQSAPTHASTDTAPTVTFLSYDSAGANPTASTYVAGGTPSAITSDGSGVSAPAKIDSAGVFRLPVATKTQRDSVAVTKGDVVFNSDTNQVEVYDGTIHKSVGAEMVQVTFSIASVAAGTSGSQTVSIAGLNVGDVVVWAGAATNTALVIKTNPVCSVAGQITLFYANPDTSGHALASTAHTFLIFRRS